MVVYVACPLERQADHVAALLEAAACLAPCTVLGAATDGSDALELLPAATSGEQPGGSLQQPVLAPAAPSPPDRPAGATPAADNSRAPGSVLPPDVQREEEAAGAAEQQEQQGQQQGQQQQYHGAAQVLHNRRQGDFRQLPLRRIQRPAGASPINIVLQVRCPAAHAKCLHCCMPLFDHCSMLPRSPSKHEAQLPGPTLLQVLTPAALDDLSGTAAKATAFAVYCKAQRQLAPDEGSSQQQQRRRQQEQQPEQPEQQQPEQEQQQQQQQQLEQQQQQLEQQQQQPEQQHHQQQLEQQQHQQQQLEQQQHQQQQQQQPEQQQPEQQQPGCDPTEGSGAAAPSLPFCSQPLLALASAAVPALQQDVRQPAPHRQEQQEHGGGTSGSAGSLPPRTLHCCYGQRTCAGLLPLAFTDSCGELVHVELLDCSAAGGLAAAAGSSGRGAEASQACHLVLRRCLELLSQLAPATSPPRLLQCLAIAGMGMSEAERGAWRRVLQQHAAELPAVATVVELQALPPAR